MSEPAFHLSPYRIRIYDGHQERYREATQADLDLALERCVAFAQYRDEIRALTEEHERLMSAITKKYAT